MRKKLEIFAVIGLLSIALMLLGVTFFLKDKEYQGSENMEMSELFSYLEKEKEDGFYFYNTDSTNIILLGTDDYSDIKYSGQADFIVLVNIDKKNHLVNVISFPRDTIADIGMYDERGDLITYTKSHLNLSYSYGGKTVFEKSKAAARAVSKLLNNIPIKYYVTASVSDLPKLIDITGETYITLEDDSLSYLNEEYVEGYEFPINKKTIETYLRSRDKSDVFSAFARQKREVNFLKFFMKEFIENEDSLEFSRIEKYLRDFETNITGETLLKLVDDFKYGNNSLNVYTLPGENREGSEFAEYHVDEKQMEEMLLKIFYLPE